jgi:putative ABC transport system ATP-binding protein
MLVARELTKEYLSGGRPLAVLRDVSFAVPQGAFVAIVGPSGSGKTTLLGLLAGLDTATRGTVLLDGLDLGALDEDARARLRGERVGFVFQSFQLIPTLTALENVQVPLELRGEADAAARARELLDRVGLAGRGHHFPAQLSGGEQQRVAIARAFVNAPRILFADEPTGNLDAATGARIVELLESLNRESGTTIVLVTHDLNLAARAQRTIRLADGVVVHDSGEPGTAESGTAESGTAESGAAEAGTAEADAAAEGR